MKPRRKKLQIFLSKNPIRRKILLPQTINHGYIVHFRCSCVKWKPPYMGMNLWIRFCNFLPLVMNFTFEGNIFYVAYVGADVKFVSMICQKYKFFRNFPSVDLQKNNFIFLSLNVRFSVVAKYF